MALHLLLDVQLPVSPDGFGIEVEAETHRIISVLPGSVAHDVGLMVGDLIMTVESSTVTSESPPCIASYVVSMGEQVLEFMQT